MSEKKPDRRSAEWWAQMARNHESLAEMYDDPKAGQVGKGLAKLEREHAALARSMAKKEVRQ